MVGPRDGVISQYTFCFGCRAITHGGIFSTRCGNFHFGPSTYWLGYTVLSHFYRQRESGFVRNLSQTLEFHGRSFESRSNDSGVSFVLVRVVIQFCAMLNCGVGLFVVCVFITSASWLLLTSHESTRVIKQAHFGRTYLGYLQLGETMAGEEVAAARLVVAVTLRLARCSHPSSTVPRCKAFWSACRKAVTSVTRLGASAVS